MILHKLENIDHARAEQLPCTAAVYLWQLSCQPQTMDVTSAAGVKNWVTRLANAPMLEVGESRLAPIDNGKKVIRSRFLTFSGVRIGGAKLTQDEIERLGGLVDSAEGRVKMLKLLELFGSVAPIVYVGQSKDLRARIRKHLSKGSSLSSRVESCGLFMENLTLRYVEVPDFKLADRRLLERIVTYICLAPLSMRAG